MDSDLLRVERGTPDPVELAALVAVLTAGGSSSVAAAPPSGVRRWNGRPGAGTSWSAGPTTAGRLRS